MANPKLYLGDLEEATYTMSATENSSFPLANLHSYLPSLRVWKSSSTAAGQTLNIDFGSAKARNFIILANHNLASVNADIGVKLQAANDSGFTSGVVTVDSDLSNYSSSDPMLLTFASTTRRYWRIYYESAAPLSVAPQIGMVFINQEFDAGHPYELPFRAKNEAFETSRSRAISGLLRTSQRHKGVLTWELAFRMMNDTFESSWLRFHQKVRGAGLPFYYSDPAGALWLVHFDDDVNDIEKFRYQLNNLGPLRLVSQGVHQNPLS